MTAPAVVRQRAVVRGRVQGVSFRAHTQAQARRLGLAGWVRNLPDGSVELEAQGAPADVAALLAFCRRGPALARVDELQAEDRAVVPGDQAFDVRR